MNLGRELNDDFELDFYSNLVDFSIMNSIFLVEFDFQANFQFYPLQNLTYFWILELWGVIFEGDFSKNFIIRLSVFHPKTFNFDQIFVIST